MKLLDRYHRWRKARRREKHLRWLRKNGVILPPPHASTKRNTTEAVPS